MTTDITPSLAVISARAENWRILCDRYHLAPDASPDALENAIKHEGFAHAILSIMGAIGDLSKLERDSHRNGKGGPVH